MFPLLIPVVIGANSVVALFSVSGALLTRAFDSTDSWAAVGIASRSWDFGDGTVAGNVTVPSHTYALAGTYVVTLTVTDLNGAIDVFSTQVTVATVVAVPPPTVITIRVPVSQPVSVVAICNLALGHCGNSKVIAALTELTTEARACSRWYEQVRDLVLRDFPWPFATRTEVLGLVQENPTSEWAFSYRTPIDAVTIRRILSGLGRFETRATRVPFRLESDVDGQLVYTDKADAEAEYTARITDAVQFPPDFTQALALRLAGEIAPQVTGGDPGKLGFRALARYEGAIAAARRASANEAQPDVEPESDSISARY